jgi:hypothetical protein
MNITRIISPAGCANGACPSLLFTDAGQVLVQGAKLAPDDRAGLEVPGHEDVVRIPREVFDALLQQYQR